MFGTIEFEVRSGKITLLRTVRREKIEDEELPCQTNLPLD